MLEIKDKEINKLPSNSKDLVAIDLEKLYLRELNDQQMLVINSFKNNCLIIEKSAFLDHKIFIPSDLAKYLETPNQENVSDFKNNLYDQDLLIQNSNYLSVIIALSYSCNLKCSYCFQQSNSKLNRTVISFDNLELIFAKLNNLKLSNPNLIIDLGLFGGEPLLPQNKKIIKKIFDYCAKNKFKIHIVTNGINLDYFAKDLIIYRKIISAIYTTINCPPQDYESISETTKVKNNSTKLLTVIKTLIDYHVSIIIGTNVDQLNLTKLKSLNRIFKTLKFHNNPHFLWSIGRVDDRFYDTNYQYLITEAELLQELIQIKDELPQNIKASFLQTTENLAKKIGINFNQNQNKGVYNYCWSTAPYSRVYYIDNELNLFRCTVTVGRKEYLIGNLKNYDLNADPTETKTYLDYQQCFNCSIGGYCSGGCAISNQTNFAKQCNYEKKAFDQFITKIFISEITKDLQYV